MLQNLRYGTRTRTANSVGLKSAFAISTTTPRQTKSHSLGFGGRMFVSQSRVVLPLDGSQFSKMVSSGSLSVSTCNTSSTTGFLV